MRHTMLPPKISLNSCQIHTLPEACVLLWVYAMQKGSLVPTFRDNLSVPYPSVKQCSPEVCNKLPVYAVWHPRRARISFTPRRKPKIPKQHLLPHFVRIVATGYILSTTAVTADAGSAQGHDKRDTLYYRQLSTLRCTVNISIWSNANISDQRCSTCPQDQLSPFLSRRLWQLDGQG
jgi:hypothetical protein